MNELVIIKLGGSIVTKKFENGVIDYSRIRMLAEQIAPYAGSTTLIIVHGAGSCGHPEAKAYDIPSGVTKENAEGIYVTHEAVSGLNHSVIAVLREAGIEAVSLSPFGCCLAENGRLVSAGISQIKAMLALGIVPVLHGDVVMDTKRGACIISGDQIIPYLAVRLGAKRIGLATDVGGVLSNGEIVPEITRKNVADINLGGSLNTDITGGMRGKINELLLLADDGIDSHIFAATRLADFLAGKNCGTLVRK
jgi:isopentenyl phosphate kinase